MVNVTGYAYPWDFLDDDAAAHQAADLGVDVVALAANYHATRVVTPLHPTRRVLEVPDPALYIPLRPEAWRDQRLQPQAPGWLASDDSFNEAARRLDRVGLTALAWIVVTHIDDAGRDHRELVVHNVFGEPYSYALCPSNEDVRQYCRTLVEEVLLTTDAPGVVLEACGPFGIEHGGLHDKSDMAALNTVERTLLSLCFCSSCERGLRDVGIEPNDLALSVRRALSGDVNSIEAALGTELADALGRFRSGLSAQLRRELTDVVTATRPGASVSVHAASSPWATGSFPALGDAGDRDTLSSVVANCWNAATANDELTRLNETVASRSNLGAYIRADLVTGPIDPLIEHYRSAGMNELHLYHLGLLTPSSHKTAEELISASHRA